MKKSSLTGLLIVLIIIFIAAGYYITGVHNTSEEQDKAWYKYSLVFFAIATGLSLSILGEIQKSKFDANLNELHELSGKVMSTIGAMLLSTVLVSTFIPYKSIIKS